VKNRNIFFYLFILLLNFGNLYSQTTNEGMSADSLILELREEFFKKIEGTWILNSSDSNYGINISSKSINDEILIVSKKEIAFYTRKKNSKKLKLKVSEKIVPKDKIFAQNYITVVFANKEIWQITLQTNNLLYFINTGQFLENGFESRIVCGNQEKTYARVE
jgi:uncharacterized membrane protein